MVVRPDPQGETGLGHADLARRLRELEFLNALVLEIARADSAHSPDDILALVTRKVTEVLGVEESSIRLLTEAPGNPLVTLVRNVAPKVNALDFVLDQTVTGWILKERRALVSSDLGDDPRFPGLHGLRHKVRAIIAVPMLCQGTVYGVLSACRRDPCDFDESEVAFLSTIGTQAAELIEAARLRAIAVGAARMQAELAVARRLQEHLGPDKAPTVPGYDLWAATRPALEVGGDYHDAFALPGGLVAFAVGDATGKGVPAAILISAVQATLRAELRARARLRAEGGESAGVPALQELIASVNRDVSEITDTATYATLFTGLLDPASGEVRYVRAGHEPPFHVAADGAVTRLTVGGPPIGLVPEAEYASDRVILAPGECLILYSDGVTEAVHPVTGEVFGDARFAALIPALASRAAAEIGAGVIDAVREFAGAAEPADDVTVLVVKRL
jgi:sigma-B regulation protein RsbU (phosphoserine phosphatase)